MKPVFTLSVLFIYIIGSAICSYSKINLKQIPSIRSNRLLQDSSDEPENTGNETSLYYEPDKKSSGLSAGSICAIAIPCIAALVGVGAAAAILGGGASAAAGVPVLANPVAQLPPPNFVDTSLAKLAVPQEIPVQPQIVQPQIVQPEIVQPVEIPPQPVQQVIQPIPKVETPILNIPQQPMPVPQPQLVPVQQMQLIPVQQVEMVPVQHVEMVPVQEVVPTYQAAAEVVPQMTQVSEVAQIPQVTQISETQISGLGQGIESGFVQGVEQGLGQGIGQGIHGGEFITAPEGYGTSVVQSSVNPLNNLGEFSSQNLM